MLLKMLNTTLTKYISSTVVAALILNIYALFFIKSLLPLGPALFFIALVVLVENLTFSRHKNVGISLNFTLLLAVTVLYGIGLAAVSGWFAGLLFSNFRQEKNWPIKKWVFNGAQCSLATTLAGLVYLKTGGLLLSQTAAGLTLANFLALLIPIVLAAATFFVVNSSLVAVYIYFASGEQPLHIWQQYISWTAPLFFALVPLALALAQIYLWGGGFSLLLFIIPLLVARQVFQTYISLKDTYLEVIKSLVAVLEAKDPYTKGHSERVAALAFELGKTFKLKPEKLTILKYAGILHDIGKIGIPHQILRKPARLSLYEYEQIKAHPESGALILQELKFFDPIIPIVFHHHERYDGTGYVDGLKCKEIPFLARILAVADAYDAMTSPRPYRAALTKEEACQELLINSGTQFDPLVVNKLLKLVGYQEGQQYRAGLETQLQFDDATV